MYSKLIVFGFAFLLFITNQSFAQEEDKLVILHTSSGNLVMEFFPDDAPNHVDNFIKLVEDGYYDRTVFHRVIKDFMIQGGDPKTKPGAYDTVNEWGTGDPGYTINAEFNDIKHNRGIVSMARAASPNSAGSQFFIVHKDSNFLDGQYTVFGRLATQESFETLDKIANLETPPEITIPLEWGKGEILSAEVVNRSEVADLLELGELDRTSTFIPEISEGVYSNEELGFSSIFPAGWIIQEPEKTAPNTPDVAAIGPQVGDFYPTISVSVVESNGTSLDDRINKVKESLQPAIDSQQLEIVSEEKTTINELEASSITTKGVFITQTGAINIKFKETSFANSDKFYILTYANSEDDFDNSLQHFDNTLNSFVILESESPGGGCLIATAAFGSEFAPQVQMLREIRDNTVLNTASGTSFMTAFNQFYYSFSPAIADMERENELFKETVKLAITPLLTTLSILNYVDIDSEEEMLGYGISIILLNVGMYFVAPAMIIIKIKNKK